MSDEAGNVRRSAEDEKPLLPCERGWQRAGRFGNPGLTLQLWNACPRLRGCSEAGAGFSSRLRRSSARAPLGRLRRHGAISSQRKHRGDQPDRFGQPPCGGGDPVTAGNFTRRQARTKRRWSNAFKFRRPSTMR